MAPRAQRKRHLPALPRVAVLGMVVLLAPGAAWACGEGETVVGVLDALTGEVRLDGRPRPRPGTPICAGDTVRVGSASRATITLIGARTPMRLDENTVAGFAPPPDPESGFVSLLRGAVYFLTEVRRTLTIETPFATAGIDGTEVHLRVREGAAPGAGAAELIVLEGEVALTAPGGRPPLEVEGGERATADAAGQLEVTALPGAEGGYGAMRRVIVGELSWTLFYPDVLVATEAAAHPELAAAARLLAAGQVGPAEARLATAPAEATAAGLRDALRAIIAFGQGDAAAALALADAAVAQAPGSAAGHLARSYALQLEPDIEAARAAARAAVEADPANGLARARLAEVELMRGATRAARRSAEEAARLEGGPLTAIVQGFAELAAFAAGRAEDAFRRALAAESQNPLALLGLGLAKIRQGDLAEGRRLLEAAVVQDPSSSLLRAYLGKAYIEEREDSSAAKQLDIAKALDPDDPTPWFYDAIRKQLDNRPVEALRDAERSIELNDNRAPFRSRLLLDQDRAARAVALGRIYDDLGFSALGRSEAARAVLADPASSGAHRFLSDVYVGEPRLEIARVSELLQAQLQQPVGTNPIQPSLAFTDLDIVRRGGPARVSFDEFSGLFQRDGVQVNAAGLVGSNETIGGEAAGTVSAGRVSASVGRFHYQTDGFRENFDLEHDITTLFGQADLNELVSVQAEYRRRDTTSGDRQLNFDLDQYDPSLNDSIEESVYRVGGRLTPAPGHVGLLSAIYTDREDKIDFDRPENPASSPVVTDARDNVGQIEGQYIGELAFGEVIAGAGRAVSDGRRRRSAGITRRPTTEREVTATDGYLVLRTELTDELSLQGRVGYSDVDAGDVGMGGFTPALGLLWQPTPNLTVRGAASRTIKRPYVANQTIQPTQVAGLNELFDDPDATRADQIAGAVDLKLRTNLWLGADVYLRDLSREVSDEDSFNLTDQRDEQYSVYAYSTIGSRVGISARLIHERFDDDDEGTLEPQKIESIYLPLGIGYFHPLGWFGTAEATFVHQDVDTFDFDGNRRMEGDAGWLIDLSAGLRLPNGRGLFAVEVANLLDRELSFQDQSFRSSRDTVEPRFLPSRTFLARINFNF